MPENITFIYDNPVDTATLTPSSEVAMMPAENLKTRPRTEKWRTTGCASESLVIYTPECPQMNALAIVEHNLSRTAQIRVQAANDNSWASTPVDVTFDAHEAIYGYGEGGFGEGGFGGGRVYAPNRLQELVLKFIDELLGAEPAGYKYKKITFIDPDNEDGYLEMGRIYLAPYYESTRNYNKGARVSFIDLSTVDYSESGVPFTDERPILLEAQLNISNIETGELYNQLLPFFATVGRRKDFVLCLDPESAAGRLALSGYGRFTSDLPMNQQSYWRFALSGITWRETR